MGLIISSEQKCAEEEDWHDWDNLPSRFIRPAELTEQDLFLRACEPREWVELLLTIFTESSSVPPKISIG